MSRIYDALKKAEAERHSPSSASSAADSTRTVSQELPAVASGAGEWGVIPADFLKELSAVRRLVESKLPGQARVALGIVSSVAGEGATTVLLGFARTLAGDSRIRILMVDADGEGSELSRQWADPGVRGWSDLQAPEDAPATVARTTVPNVDLLAFGGRPGLSPAAAAELLVECVRRVADSYDYVLFDCGSVLGTASTRYLAGALDGLLLVVHSSNTRREICHKALEELRAAQASVLGVVLNRRQYLIPEVIYKRV